MKHIYAEHTWRRDSNGNPLRKTFSLRVWNYMTSITYQNRTYPRQGWVQKRALEEFVPPEASNEPKSLTALNNELTLKERIQSGQKCTGEELVDYVKANHPDINPNQTKPKLIEALKQVWANE